MSHCFICIYYKSFQHNFDNRIRVSLFELTKLNPFTRSWAEECEQNNFLLINSCVTWRGVTTWPNNISFSKYLAVSPALYRYYALYSESDGSLSRRGMRRYVGPGPAQRRETSTVHHQISYHFTQILNLLIKKK